MNKKGGEENIVLQSKAGARAPLKSTGASGIRQLKRRGMEKMLTESI